jgi:hypothetical protein
MKSPVQGRAPHRARARNSCLRHEKTHLRPSTSTRVMNAGIAPLLRTRRRTWSRPFIPRALDTIRDKYRSTPPPTPIFETGPWLKQQVRDQHTSITAGKAAGAVQRPLYCVRYTRRQPPHRLQFADLRNLCVPPAQLPVTSDGHMPGAGPRRNPIGLPQAALRSQRDPRSR